MTGDEGGSVEVVNAGDAMAENEDEGGEEEKGRALPDLEKQDMPVVGLELACERLYGLGL